MFKEDAPLVAIAVASYNNAVYIEETLDSINAQTYNNIELLIIDDCSTDNSVLIVEEWLKKCRYPHRFIKLQKNIGVTKMANAMLENSSKDAVYYSLLASDDTILPAKIETQVKILENSNEKVAMVYTDAYIMDEHSRRKVATYMPPRIGKAEFAPEGNILDPLLESMFMATQSALYKKKIFDVIGRYDETIPYEDWDMTLRIAEKYEVLFCPDIFVNYRKMATSVTGKVVDWYAFKFPVFIKHIEKKGMQKKAEDAIINMHLSGNPKVKDFLKIYNAAAKQQHKYSWFIKNNLPIPLLKTLKIIRQIKRKIGRLVV